MQLLDIVERNEHENSKLMILQHTSVVDALLAVARTSLEAGISTRCVIGRRIPSICRSSKISNRVLVLLSTPTACMKKSAKQVFCLRHVCLIVELVLRQAIHLEQKC